jgi:hypothetical protein
MSALATPSAPSFTDEWYDHHDLQTVVNAAMHTTMLPGAAVEVGCWEGRSTIQLAQVFAPQTLLAVDSWVLQERMADELSGRELTPYERFRQNIEGFARNVAVFRCDWREFFEAFDGPLRFLHLDGSHQYPDVHDNIELALAQLVPGGIMCGHDYSVNWPGVVQAVRELLPAHNVEGNVWYWQRPLA